MKQSLVHSHVNQWVARWPRYSLVGIQRSLGTPALAHATEIEHSLYSITSDISQRLGISMLLLIYLGRFADRLLYCSRPQKSMWVLARLRFHFYIRRH